MLPGAVPVLNCTGGTQVVFAVFKAICVTLRDLEIHSVYMAKVLLCGGGGGGGMHT